MLDTVAPYEVATMALCVERQRSPWRPGSRNFYINLIGIL